MADRTVRRLPVEGKMYRLAHLGHIQGFAIQVAEGKGYQTIEQLGHMTEREAREFFKNFTGEE